LDCCDVTIIDGSDCAGVAGGHTPNDPAMKIRTRRAIVDRSVARTFLIPAKAGARQRVSGIGRPAGRDMLGAR